MRFKINACNKWYIATVISCLAPFIGVLIVIPLAIYEFSRCEEKNDSILYSAIASGIYSLFMSGYVVLIVLNIDLEELWASLYLIIHFLSPFGISAFLFVVYARHSKRSVRLMKIRSLIKNDHITSIPLIAEILGIDNERTVKYIKIVIRMGHLGNACVDDAGKEIILKECIWAHQLCVCNNCGAAITVNFGQTLICEYCGGALSVKRIGNQQG